MNPILYVIVVKNPSLKQNTKMEKKMMKEIPIEKAEEWLRKCFKLHQDHLQFNESLSKLRKKGPTVQIKTLSKISFGLFLSVLQRDLGIELEYSFSGDKKDIFLKLKAKESNIFFQAEFIRYSLPIRITEEKKFGFQVYSPLGQFTNRAYSKKVYQEKNGEVFQYTDKVRVVKTMMSILIDFEELKQMNLIKSEYPLEDDKIKEIYLEWIDFRNIFKSIKIDEIKDYFGEKIAFYFAWLEFYTCWLVVPSCLGIVCGILDYVDPGEEGKMTFREWSLVLFASILSLSSTLFDQLWIRKQSLLALRWGVTDFKQVEEQRSGFQGSLEFDPVTGVYKKISHNLVALRKIIGGLVSLFFIALVVATVMGLMIYKAILISSGESKNAMYVGVLNAVQIKVFNFVYQKIAKLLTSWENFETQSEHNNSLILKLFCFQFINSYISLFYIAFIKSHVETCTDNNCLYDLTTQLASIYITNLLLNLVEIGVPLLITKVKIYMSSNQLRGLEEMQSTKSSYDEPIEDYMEIVIGYGYLVLFGVAFPFTPLLSLFVCLVEMKVDSFKLCKLTKRPFPAKDSTIGIWINVIQAVGLAGVVTNVAVLIFTSDVFDFMNGKEKWITFFIIEHFLIVLKFGIAMVIPDKSDDVQKGIIWTKRMANEKVFERFVNVNLEKIIKGLTFEVSDNMRRMNIEDVLRDS